MKNTQLILPLRALAISGLAYTLGAGALSASVTIPYSNDFSSDADDFSAATGYSYDGTNDLYHYERGTSATGLSLVDVADLTSPVDFTVSTSFTPLLVGSGRSFGFAVMSDVGTSEYLLVDWSSTSSLRLHEVAGGGAGTLKTSTGSITMTQDTEYTLTFSGVYTDTVNKIMDLSFSVSDGTNTDTVAFSGFNASGLSGNTLVGYRAYGLYANNVNFDNFSLSAIPEPSTLALLLGAGVGAMVFGRRRRGRAC